MRKVHWLQALKTEDTSAGGLSQRGEWEATVREGKLDPVVLQGTPWPTLDADGTLLPQLAPCFETDATRTLRLFTFVDVGNVYGENDKVSFSDMRASAGVGLSWISPLGPLRLAYAQPVRKFAGDRIQKLQFQIGTSF